MQPERRRWPRRPCMGIGEAALEISHKLTWIGPVRLLNASAKGMLLECRTPVDYPASLSGIMVSLVVNALKGMIPIPGLEGRVVRSDQKCRQRIAVSFSEAHDELIPLMQRAGIVPSRNLSAKKI